MICVRCRDYPYRSRRKPKRLTTVVYTNSIEAVEDIVHNQLKFVNMQNIPSHAVDIRHMFRATPGYVMLSSDYSKMCAVVKPT